MLLDVTWEQAVSELKEGNRRFRENRMLHPRMDSKRIRANAAEQHPFAVILACADSRVAPEIVFDQGIGDLFTVRVAGNVANGDEIASVEYAIEQLHTPLCVVMGHTGCGAVQAVLSGAPMTLDMEQSFRQIKAAIGKARRDNPGLSAIDLANAAVRGNVFEAVDILRLSLRIPLQQQKVHVAGAEYRTDSGEVVWLDLTD